MEKTILFAGENLKALSDFNKKLYQQIMWINEYFDEMEGEFYQPGFYVEMIRRDMNELRRSINRLTLRETIQAICSLLDDVRDFNKSGCTYERKAFVVDANVKDFVYAFLMYMDQEELAEYIARLKRMRLLTKAQKELLEIYGEMIKAVKLEEEMKNASM